MSQASSFLMASIKGLPDALEPVGLLEELFGEATANARRRILPVLVHGKRLGEGKCGRTSTTKSPRGTNGNVQVHEWNAQLKFYPTILVFICNGYSSLKDMNHSKIATIQPGIRVIWNK
jgi:hypothetical protein